MTNTIQSRVLNALTEGQALRFSGYPIYLNSHKDTKGRVTQKYRLGTASRKVIAAGYKALASKVA